MARALGVGGVFFKAQDPEALARWYHQWLHLPFDMDHPEWGASFKPDTMPPGSLTVFSMFPANTTYLNPSTKDAMFNFIVDDLDGALAQVKEGGATLVDEIQNEPYGRFGWFLDPEGNKIELWEPKADGGF